MHVGVGLELLRHVPGSPGPVGVLAWVLAGSTALAAALWWLVEEPALRGRRPRPPRRRTAAEVATAGSVTPAGR